MSEMYGFKVMLIVLAYVMGISSIVALITAIVQTIFNKIEAKENQKMSARWEPKKGGK